MMIPTISAKELAFTGFGDKEVEYAVGYCWMRASDTDGVPLAFFIQHAEDGPELGVYVGVLHDEGDSSDINMFRQYAINMPKDQRNNDKVLWALNELNHLHNTLQVDMHINVLDRFLVKVCKAVRCV